MSLAMMKRRFSEPVPKKMKASPEDSDYEDRCASPSPIKNRHKHPTAGFINKYRDSAQPMINARREKMVTQPIPRNESKTSPPNKKRKDLAVNLSPVELLERLELVTNRNSSLKKSMKNMKHQYDVSLKEKATILDDLQRLRVEKQSQENELKIVKRSLACLQKENKHEKQLFTSGLKLADAEQKLQISEVKRLTTVNESLIKENELKEQLMEKLETRLRMQERTIESFKKQLEDMTNTQKLDLNNEESVRRLERELKSLLSEQVQLKSENAKQKQEMKDMKAEIEKLDSAKRSLSIKKSEVEDKLASLYLGISNYESTIEELKKNWKTSDAELLKANEARTHLEKKNNNLTSEMKGMKELLRDQTTEILSLNEEIRKSKELLEELANKSRLEQAAVQKLSDENVQLKKEKSISIGKTEELQQALQSKIREVASLTDVIDDLKKQLSKAEFEATAVEKEKEVLKNKVQCFEIYQSNLVRDYEEAKDRLDQLEKEKMSMTVQNNLYANEKAELQVKLDDKKTELFCFEQKVNAEKERFKQDWELLQKEKEDLMEKNHNLEQKIQQMSAGFCMNFEGLKRRPIQISDQNKNCMFSDTRDFHWNSSYQCSTSFSQKPHLLMVKKEEKWFSQAEVGTQTEVDSYLQEQMNNVERLERRLKQIENNYYFIMDKNYNLKRVNREKCQAFSSLQCKYNLLIKEHQKLKTDCWDLENNNEKLKREYWCLKADYQGARRDVWEERNMKVQLYEDNKVIQEDLNTLKRSFRNLNTVLTRT